MNRDQKTGTWLRIILLPQRMTGKLRVLPLLFSKPVFYPVSMFNAIWMVIMLIHYNPNRATELYLSLSLRQIIEWLFGLAIISFFHEIGHVSALLRCGGTPGGVGLSICCFLPRGWSELDDMGKLPSAERAYVDLGGIYFQLLLTEAVFIANTIWLRNQVITAICIASTQMALINLIPNKGSDGYWMIKDLFGIEDISARAKELFCKSNGQKEKHDQKEIQITVALLIIRNIALIYLFAFVVTVSAAAGKTLIRDLMAVFQSTDCLQEALTIDAIRQFLSRRLGCIAFLIVVTQNLISSILQISRGKAQKTSEKKSVS